MDSHRKRQTTRKDAGVDRPRIESPRDPARTQEAKRPRALFSSVSCTPFAPVGKCYSIENARRSNKGPGFNRDIPACGADRHGLLRSENPSSRQGFSPEHSQVWVAYTALTKQAAMQRCTLPTALQLRLAGILEGGFVPKPCWQRTRSISGEIDPSSRHHGTAREICVIRREVDLCMSSRFVDP